MREFEFIREFMSRSIKYTFKKKKINKSKMEVLSSAQGITGLYGDKGIITLAFMVQSGQIVNNFKNLGL